MLHSGSSWASVTLKSITEPLGFVLLIAKVLYSLKIDEGINRLVIGLVVLFILHSTKFVSPFCDGKGPYNVQNHCDCCDQREQKLIDGDENDAHKGHLLWERFGVTQLVFLSHQGTMCSLLEHHTSTSVGTMLNSNIPIKKLRIVEEKENREEAHTVSQWVKGESKSWYQLGWEFKGVWWNLIDAVPLSKALSMPPVCRVKWKRSESECKWLNTSKEDIFKAFWDTCRVRQRSNMGFGQSKHDAPRPQRKLINLFGNERAVLWHKEHLWCHSKICWAIWAVHRPKSIWWEMRSGWQAHPPNVCTWMAWARTTSWWRTGRWERGPHADAAPTVLQATGRAIAS